MKFLMDLIFKKLIARVRKVSIRSPANRSARRDQEDLLWCTKAEDLEIYKRVQQYEQDNGGHEGSIDFKVSMVPNGLSSVLDGSSSKDNDAMTMPEEQAPEDNINIRKYQGQFAPKFHDLQSNRLKEIPVVLDEL